jgi:hypothetical protein
MNGQGISLGGGVGQALWGGRSLVQVVRDTHVARAR